MRTTILTVVHAAFNLQRHTARWTFADWRADYLATRELRLERMAARS
jgi:hypothetical protein